MLNKELVKNIIIENENYISSINRIFPRKIHFPVTNNIKKVVVLYGVRRSGKSFILLDIFKTNKGRALYIDFEDERLLKIRAEDLDKIKEAFFELNPNLIGRKDVVFLFDEIQNVDGWERFVRRLAQQGFKVYCAGSSSKITPEKIHTSLRGRTWSIEVFPFSFREFVFAKIGKDQNVNSLIYGDNRIIVKKLFDEYINFGGMPEVIFSSSEFEKRKILKEYLKAMYFKDIVERFEIKNLPLLNLLWEKLFSSFSTRFSLNAFYRRYKNIIPFSKDKLYGYYHHFLESMLISEVRKFTESHYKRQLNPAKIYLVDHSLATHMRSEDKGRILENIVYMELKRRDFEVYYYNENSECDFVAVKENKTYLIQVSWELNKENFEREIQGLVEASGNIETDGLFIITHDQEENLKINRKNICMLPAWKWLLFDSDKDGF